MSGELHQFRVLLPGVHTFWSWWSWVIFNQDDPECVLLKHTRLIFLTSDIERFIDYYCKVVFHHGVSTFVVTVDIQLKTRMKWDFSMELFVEILTSMNLENCRIDNVLPDPRNRHAGF